MKMALHPVMENRSWQLYITKWGCSPVIWPLLSDLVQPADCCSRSMTRLVPSCLLQMSAASHAIPSSGMDFTACTTLKYPYWPYWNVFVQQTEHVKHLSGVWLTISMVVMFARQFWRHSIDILPEKLLFYIQFTDITWQILHMCIKILKMLLQI